MTKYINQPARANKVVFCLRQEDYGNLEKSIQIRTLVYFCCRDAQISGKRHSNHSVSYRMLKSYSRAYEQGFNQKDDIIWVQQNPRTIANLRQDMFAVFSYPETQISAKRHESYLSFLFVRTNKVLVSDDLTRLVCTACLGIVLVRIYRGTCTLVDLSKSTEPSRTQGKLFPPFLHFHTIEILRRDALNLLHQRCNSCF